MENCGQGAWMPGVEKVESLLGKGAGAGMVKCPEGQTKACGFSPPGNRGHGYSYADAHSTALVSDGWIKWLIHGYAK